MGDTILIRRGTAVNLPDLQEGEPGFATDNKALYVGDNTGTAGSASYIGGGVYTDALQYEPNTFTQATIEAALTAIKTPVNGGLNCTLLLRPGAWVISSNANWSAYTNVTFKIVPGAVISHGAYTVSIGGPIEAGQYQIFSGTGTVTMVDGRVPEVFPIWWGGDPTGVLDSAAAINAAEKCGVNKINMTGAWGIASPIFLTRQLTVFDGGSRVGSYIAPLAVDISTGAYPNALFVNKINAWNGTIKSLRFPYNGLSYTGWIISATEGGSGGVEQSMFSGHLYDLWVDPGTLAAGFFTGGFYDSWAHDIQFENIKVRFNCPGTGGNALSGSHIYAISESTTVGSLVKAVSASRSWISGITSYGTNAGVLIDLTSSMDINISDINAEAIAADSWAGLLAVTSSTNIKLDNFSIKRTSGGMKGIYVSGSELKASNGLIKGTAGPGIYSIYITGAANDVNFDNVTVDTSQLAQIVTSTAGGSLGINNSKYTNGSLAILTNLGVDTLDVTIQNSKLLNNDVESMFIYASSGDVKLQNNDIGIDDGVSTATYLFYFTGTGRLLMGGNNIVGLGSSGETHPSQTQKVIYTGINPGGSSAARATQAAPTAKTTATTLTIAELLTNILTGTHAAGATQGYILPTGTLSEGGVAMSVGDCFDWVLINLSAAAVDTITLTAGANHTIVGNPIIQSAHSTTGGIYGNSSMWGTRKTAANTYVTYRIN